MRKVGKEGRALVRSFSYPKSKDSMIEEIDAIARREGQYFSDVVLSLLEDYYKKHSKSNNPQTQINIFESEEVMAIPQIYEKKTAPWDKFFAMVDKKEYKELQTAHSALTKRMNDKYNELFPTNEKFI